MGRPSNAADTLKKHVTKEEMEQRKAAEKAALTGFPLRESEAVSKDKIAHEEFLRVCELLTAVGKNDAMFEAVINDYCSYKSDISRYLKLRKKIEKDKTIPSATRYKLLLDCDRQIEAYRKKRFDIEKETGFTVASSLRAIPKKPQAKNNPLLEALGGGGV